MNIFKFIVSTVALSMSLLATLFFFYHKDIYTKTLHSPTPDIRVIYDLQPFQREVELVDKDSLVIFDINKVVLVKSDPWERGFKEERCKANTVHALHKEISGPLTPAEYEIHDHLWSIHTSQNKEILLDRDIVDIIKNLQKKSIKTIALTRFLVGKMGKIPSLQQWRIKKLLSYDIDFSKSFPKSNPIVFKQFLYGTRSPVFEKGILFTTFATTKGKLLKAFFEKINWYPKKVIMIDDSIANLKSIYEELKSLDIPFIGFEYKAAEKLPAFFDKDIAEFQMKYLLENKKWLSAKAAAKLLNKQWPINN